MKKMTAKQSKYGVLRNKFLGQDFRRTLFVFKMSTHRPGNRIELMRRMIEGDLYHAYIIFDHIKEIHN